MSVSYDIKEHLRFEGRKIGENCGAEICADVMRRQLAALAGRMLLNEAQIYRLCMTADDRYYVFSGEEITPEFKAILTALDRAADVDLVVDYHCIWRGDGGNYDDLGPFALMSVLEDPEKEIDLTNVFYSAWNCDRSNYGECGILCAYGSKAGKTYHGRVPFEPVDYEGDVPFVTREQAEHVPTGDWHGGNSPLVASVKKDERADLSAFIAACNAFTALCDKEELQFTNYDDEIEFRLNSVKINSDRDVQCFLELLKELKKEATGGLSLIAEFAELSRKDVSLMVIEEDGQGDFVVRLARV